MIAALVACAMFLPPLILMWLVKPACGAYDPADYRCGKCDICRREKGRT